MRSELHSGEQQLDAPDRRSRRLVPVMAGRLSVASHRRSFTPTLALPPSGPPQIAFDATYYARCLYETVEWVCASAAAPGRNATHRASCFAGRPVTGRPARSIGRRHLRPNRRLSGIRPIGGGHHAVCGNAKQPTIVGPATTLLRFRCCIRASKFGCSRLRLQPAPLGAVAISHPCWWFWKASERSPSMALRSASHGTDP